MFSHQKSVKKALFLSDLPQWILFCQNKSQLSNLQHGHRKMFLFNPPFWPFKTHWTCQISCFLIRRVLKKPFFLSDLPPGGLVLPKIRVSCQTFKMVIERCFYLIPHFWPFKNHWTCQKPYFLIRRVLKKPLFLSDLPPGGLVFPK